MNKYAELLFTLSFFTLACKGTFPEIFNYTVVQVPSIVVFSILAPVGFSISLWTYFSSATKTTWQWFKPASYLILFCLVLGLTQLGFYGSHSTYANLAVIDRTYSAKLFNDLGAAETEEQRAAVAKYIYSEFGAAVPYAKQNGIITIYKPDQEATELYKETAEIHAQAKVLKEFFRNNAYQSMQISFYLIAIFILVFCGSMFFLQSKANNALKRTP